MVAGNVTNSFERALLVLELLAHKSGLTNAEISRNLHIPSSTCCYILSRLEREGYVARDQDTSRYEVGLKLMALSHGVLREMGLRRIAEPILHKLAAETKVSALFGILDRGRVMIVDKVAKADLVRVDLDIGVRLPPHTTALGKVLLAHLSVIKLDDLFREQGVPKKSSKSIDSKAKLLDELQVVRSQGYATSDEELFVGVCAVAAPIVDLTGDVRAAVSAAGLFPVNDGNIVGAVKRAAREISSRLASEAIRKRSAR